MTENVYTVLVFLYFIFSRQFIRLILKHSDLNTLLREVPAVFGCHIHNHKSAAQGLDGTLYPDDAACAFCWHIQVVCDGARRHLQYVVGGNIVQEDPT